MFVNRRDMPKVGFVLSYIDGIIYTLWLHIM